MTTILGVDVSHWQPPNLPWASWRAFGVERAYIRSSIGYRQDAAYDGHWRQARAAGMQTGVYHYLLHHDEEIAYFNPARQAQTFVGRFQGGDELPAVVDVETQDIINPGTDDAFLWAFIAEYERLTDWPLMIYTSKYFWDMLIGPGKTRYSRFPFWIAQYSKPLTLIPDVAVNVAGHQFRYKKGYLPDYGGDLDVNEWYVTAPEPTQPTAITARGKVGPQLNIQGDSDATSWLVNGEPSAGLGINIGPPGEVTAPLFWVGRNYEDAWNPNDPARDGYSGDPVPDARRYASLWFAPWLPLNPWAWLVTGPNEPIVNTVAEMEYTARFFAEMVRILRVDYGRTAVIGNWSVTHPRVELWDVYRPALRAVAQYGAVLGRHSYGPLTEDFALRHRRDNAYFTDMGYPDLPVILTECGWENIPGIDRPWGSDPRRPPEAYADYLMALNDELMADNYVLGASVFTHGVNWAGHNLNGSGVGRLMGERLAGRPRFTIPWPAPRPLPPEGEDDELTTSQKERIEAQLVVAEGAHAEIRNILAEQPAPPPWWLQQPTPFTFKGTVPQTLPLYRAPNGAFVRNQAYNNAYDIHVQAVTDDGWLFVSGWQTPDNAGDDLWLRSQDVTPAD